MTIIAPKIPVEEPNYKLMGQGQKRWSNFQLRLIPMNIMAIRIKVGEFKEK
jgi:hypothetical protein